MFLAMSLWWIKCSGAEHIFVNRFWGSVVTLGQVVNGGDSAAVQAQVSCDVLRLSSTGYAFAALKSDGSVVVWGHQA